MFESGAPARGGNGVQAARAQAAAARPGQIDAPLPVAATETARFMRVYGLVNAYRVRGHMEAQLDPLDHIPRDTHPDLDPATWGFTDGDLDRVMPSGGLFGVADATLREILQRLRATYCGPIGVEMMHITDTARRTWLQQRMEPTLNQPLLDRDTQLHILERVAAAEVFENFVHTKYVGTKRFSLEGGESL